MVDWCGLMFVFGGYVWFVTWYGFTCVDLHFCFVFGFLCCGFGVDFLGFMVVVDLICRSEDLVFVIC